MIDITLFWSGDNQNITILKPQERGDSFLAPKKIMNFIIIIMLMRFIQQFPPAEGAVARDIKLRDVGNFDRLNRTIRSINWKPNPKANSERTKLEKTKSRIAKNEDKSIPEFVDVSLPSGIKLSAAGYYTVFILSGLCGLIFVCERFTNVIMCICNRLNNAPAQNVKDERVRLVPYFFKI